MSGTVLVLDTSPLSHFARAGHLPTLQKLVGDHECVTTRAVVGELQQGAQLHHEIQGAIDLDWIRVVSCDELNELYLFAQYMNRLGNVERNAGEATVLAWAEAHGAAAFVDDQVAYNVGRKRGVTVYRTLRLVIEAARRRLLEEASAQDLVRDLVDTEAWFPVAARDDLFGWARAIQLY